MKIALASARTVDRDIAHNLSQLERYTKEAKAAGADLVCFGEAFLQGFNALSWQYEIDKTIALTTSSAEFAHIQSLTKKTGIDKATVLTTVEAFMDSVKDSLSNDENVYLRGFGSFIVKKRAQKTARNISKNTTIIIPEHNIPAFKPAKTFTISVKK